MLYLKEVVKTAEFGGTGPVFIIFNQGSLC